MGVELGEKRQKRAAGAHLNGADVPDAYDAEPAKAKAAHAGESEPAEAKEVADGAELAKAKAAHAGESELAEAGAVAEKANAPVAGDRELTKRKLVLVAVAALSLISMAFTAVIFLESWSLATRLLAGALFLLSLIAGIFNVTGAWYFLEAHRVRVPPSGLTRFPSVAVVVASYNEPPRMVEQTLARLRSLDYPKEKLTFHLLDDSTKPETVSELASFCASSSVDFRHRGSRQGFKGGALNEFLKECKSEFIAIFDADELLTDANFLRDTLGYFEGNEKLSHVQTVKKFSEGGHFATTVDVLYSFFFRFIQPVNAAHGFSMFCGSCGVVKTAALRAMGGFPDSVTEDAAYSLKADAHGYEGVYLPKVYAHGAPIETFTGLGRQQYRYNFGNTKLIPDYLANLAKISPRKHFHYFVQIFGLHYLSLNIVLLALVTMLITFSDFRSTAEQISNMLLPPQLNLKLQIELATLISILTTLLSALIMAKMYLGSFRYGLAVYFVNFGLAFIRIKAALSALVRRYGTFHVMKKDGKDRYTLLQALRMTAAETLFSIVFFFFSLVSIWNTDFAGFFWLSWYGALFSTSFVFTYLTG